MSETSTNSNFFQNRSLVRSPFDTIVTPTYDLSNYGKDLFIPLTDAGTNTQLFTNSAAVIARNTISVVGGSNNLVEVDDYPSVVANENELMMWHAGDDTLFDRWYRYSPDAQSIISKMYLNIAFALNVSVYTSGNYSLDSVDIEIVERANDNGDGDKLIFQNRYVSGLGALTSAEAQVFIVSAVLGDLTVKKNLPLDIHCVVNQTNGVGTEH